MSIGIRESDREGNGGNGSLPQAGCVPAGTGGQDSFLRVLWRGRWLMVLCLTAAAAAAYCYLRWTPPLYESGARLLIEKPSLSSPLLGSSSTGGTPANYAQTEAEFIRSRNVITAALGDPNVLALPTVRSEEYPMEKVIRTLAVSVTRGTNIVNVAAEAAYAEDAAQIVNAVVRAYIRQREDSRKNALDELLKDLNDEYRVRIEQFESAFARRRAFEKENPEVMASVRGGTIRTSLEELRKECDAAGNVRQEWESLYRAIQEFKFDPEGMRLYLHNFHATDAVREDEGKRTRLQEELLSIEARLKQLAMGGGALRETAQPRDYQNKLRERAGQIQQELDELDEVFVQTQISMVKVRVEEARAREKQRMDKHQQEFSKVKALADLDARYASLVAECDMLQGRCDSLKKQIDAIDLTRNLERLNIHVLEWALPATKPSSPQVEQVVAGALALGLMAGAGLAFLRDWRRQRVSSAHEIMMMLGAPILGAVPSMAKHGFAARAQRLWLASGSVESEAYRSIRTALFFGAGQKATTILVTSPERMEGKTTVVSNLGIAMAQAGQKTLILDADLRKPMQHRAFSFKRSDGGLTDVLTGAMSLERAIRPTVVPGLDILTGGGAVSNPSELLGSGAFTQVLGQLQAMYDRILVDSPPVAIVTDAQILAAYCSLTLLVLRVQTSSRIATQRARDALRTVKAKLGGVVLNDVPRRDIRYHYHGRNGSHNGHSGSNGDRRAVSGLVVKTDPLPEGTPAGPARR